MFVHYRTLSESLSEFTIGVTIGVLQFAIESKSPQRWLRRLY